MVATPTSSKIFQIKINLHISSAYLSYSIKSWSNYGTTVGSTEPHTWSTVPRPTSKASAMDIRYGDITMRRMPMRDHFSVVSTGESTLAQLKNGEAATPTTATSARSSCHRASPKDCTSFVTYLNVRNNSIP
jgi:hypothetical protein